MGKASNDACATNDSYGFELEPPMHYVNDFFNCRSILVQVKMSLFSPIQSILFQDYEINKTLPGTDLQS